MKYQHTVLALATASALLLSGAAFSLTNNAYIDQIGDNNSVNLWQYQDAGGGHLGGGNNAGIYQYGNYNGVTATQGHANALYIGQNGWGISGQPNVIDVVQHKHNKAKLLQWGGHGNMITLRQWGHDDTVRIGQRGNHNSATVRQFHP